MKPIFLSLAFCLVSTCSFGATIEFAGTLGPLSSTNEGVFTYTLVSGEVIRSDFGNPQPALEGSTASQGGSVSFVRNDVANGAFYFLQADLANVGFNGSSVTFSGYLGGVLQAEDVFFTLDGDDSWASFTSSNLAGLAIDRLVVTLPAQSSPVGWTELDNLVLSTDPPGGVPEPSTIAMLGAGLALITIKRRSRA
jgi:hypothetical protein